MQNDKRKCRPKIPAAERFQKHLRLVDECLEWTGSTRHGYGQLAIDRINGVQHIMKAHRFAWELQNGKIPNGMLVCHKCDNRLCVKVDHLFLGTYQDNNNDMFQKKRGHVFDGSHLRGEKNPNTRLTSEKVVAIRSAFDEVRSLTIVGKAFGVTKSTVSNIICRRTWGHVA